MQLDGKYTLTIRGNTKIIDRGGLNTSAIAYQFERLLTGKKAEINFELKHFGITVEEGDLVKKLRAADETTVFKALDGAYVHVPLTGTDELLEFYRRMIDQIVGEEET